MSTNTIRISKSDLETVRFPSGKSVLLGDKLLTFKSSSTLNDALWNITIGLRSNDVVDYPLRTSFARAEDIGNNIDRNSAKTIEDMFVVALKHFLERGAPFYGEEIKYVSDEEPAFIMEVYGMQDALFYAMKDSRPYMDSAGLTDEDVFEAFIYIVGDWWVADLCDYSCALRMMRLFFDNYYPVIKKQPDA